MKKAIIVFATVLELLVPETVSAQGTLYLSNLGQPSSGSAAVGSNSWLAAPFRTGINPGGYQLNSIQLSMAAASGDPNGFIVSLYNLNGSQPGSSLGTLIGSDPGTGGVFTFSASGLTLAPSSFYCIVATGATVVAQGAYPWTLADSGSFSSSDGWTGSIIYYTSTDGSGWSFIRPRPLQFAVDATAVPEPTSLAMILCCGATCGAFALRRRRAS
jgi:hypothetical protein